jgi:hypothetical protein
LGKFANEGHEMTKPSVPKTKRAASKAPVTGVAKGTKVSTATPAQSDVASVDQPRVLRLKDIVEKVADLSGTKRHAAKPVIEATLRVLGDAFEAGEMVVAPSFGKARVRPANAAASGGAVTVKFRRNNRKGTDQPDQDQTLAGADE